MAVTPQTIATELGRAVPEVNSVEYQQWELWIDDALMLIDDRKVAQGVTTVLDPTKVDYVVRKAVAAYVKRPDDATQVAVSVDDGSVSKTYRSSRGLIEIRDEWWTMLGLGAAPRTAFSIDTAPPCTNHSPWCSALTYTDATTGAVVYGGAYCTCGADIAGYPIYELGY